MQSKNNRVRLQLRFILNWIIIIWMQWILYEIIKEALVFVSELIKWLLSYFMHSKRCKMDWFESSTTPFFLDFTSFFLIKDGQITDALVFIFHFLFLWEGQISIITCSALGFLWDKIMDACSTIGFLWVTLIAMSVVLWDHYITIGCHTLK